MYPSHVVNISDVERSSEGDIILFAKRDRGQEVRCWQSAPDERAFAFDSIELDPSGGVGSVDSKSPASCRPNSSRFGLNAFWA